MPSSFMRVFWNSGAVRAIPLIMIKLTINASPCSVPKKSDAANNMPVAGDLNVVGRRDSNTEKVKIGKIALTPNKLLPGVAKARPYESTLSKDKNSKIQIADTVKKRVLLILCSVITKPKIISELRKQISEVRLRESSDANRDFPNSAKSG